MPVRIVRNFILFLIADFHRVQRYPKAHGLIPPFHRGRFTLCIICGLMFVNGLREIQAQQSASQKKLAREIQQLIGQYFVNNAHWGIDIRNVRTGEPLFVLNERKNFIPASTLKILTSVFALDYLGSGFRYRTELLLSGQRESDSVWNGDCIVRGGGDPTISGRYQNNRATAIFEAWADSLKAQSIKIIRGRLIGDDDYFADEIMGANWDWDDESKWYSAHISALSFNDNCVDWYVTPTGHGRKAKVTVVPNTKYITLDHQIMTGLAGTQTNIVFSRNRCSNNITGRGIIAADRATFSGNTTVDNPTRYFVTVLKETLEQKGIFVEGDAVDIDDLKKENVWVAEDTAWVVAASYVSPPLGDMLKVVNKRSQNFFAEQILRTVGAAYNGIGEGRTAIRLMMTFLSRIGVDTNGLVIRDGSGYSHSNLLSPSALTTVLLYIRRHSEWNSFRQSLAIAGVDGTLHYRMKNTEAEGVVRAKTGYIEHARNIAGFVTTADGQELSFVIFCNHFTVDKLEVEKVQDAILVKLAKYTHF